MQIQRLSGTSQTPQATPKPPVETEFSYNPQDGVVMAPGSATLGGVQTGASVSTAKVKLKGDLKPEGGKYVYTPEDKRYFAANAFTAVNKALDVFTGAYGEPIRWAFGREQLDVTADKGEMLNAYYSRNDGGLFFFHAKDPKTKETVYSAASGEVVAHEAGHAILDAVRPGYFSTWSTDPGAFHESFGDMLAMLVSLKDDRVLDRVIEQTGGDLSKPNLAAALGEQLGMAINHTSGHNSTGGDYTRNAINQLTWQDPSTLPESGPPEQLTSEVHNFSRLWTGAFYDVVKGINEQKQAEGLDPRAALVQATDESLAMLARMLKASPEGDFTYKDMAKALLQSERSGNGGKYADLIQKVFTDRKILPDSLSLTESESTLEPGTRELTHVLSSAVGPLQGAQVSTLLSGSGQRNLVESDSERAALEKNIARLWRNGEILMTEPNQVVTTESLFKPDGEPYIGVVRWVDGGMQLERVAIGH